MELQWYVYVICSAEIQWFYREKDTFSTYNFEYLYMKYLSPLCMSVRINFQFSRFDNKYSVYIYIFMSHKFTYRCIYIYCSVNLGWLWFRLLWIMCNGFMGLYPSLVGCSWFYFHNHFLVTQSPRFTLNGWIDPWLDQHSKENAEKKDQV